MRYLSMLLVCGSIGFAQEFRATLLGRITDPSGAGVPGATVSVTNELTGVSSTTVSAGDGAYNVGFLNPGRYRLEMEASGFKKYSQSGITLEVGQRATQNVGLELGSLAEAVTVRSEAPLLESSSAAMGQVVDQRKLDAMPLNGRMIFMLNRISAAVQWRQPQLGAGGSSGLRVFDNNAGSDWSINGARLRSNEFLLDGASNTFRGRFAFGPPVDAIQEYKIHSANYDAEFGHGGGGTISMTTKSGTNELHGQLWEFIKNDKLNANSSLSNAQGLRKDPLRINSYGATVTGPVIRNRTFFMYTYDAISERVPFPIVSSTPTASERAGIFADSGLTVYDPLTTQRNAAGVLVRTPFENNRIPQSRIDAVGAKLLSFYPLPNLPGRITNFAASPNPGKYDYWAHLVRIDHHFNDANKIFVSYYRNHRDELRNNTGFGPPHSPLVSIVGNYPQTRDNEGGIVDWVRTIGPTTVFNVRLAAAHFDETDVQQQRKGFSPSDLGFRNFPYATPEPTFPRVTMDQFSDIGPGGISLKNPSDSSGSGQGNLTKVFSRHTMKLGGSFRELRGGTNSAGQSSGTFSFSRNFTRRDPNTADAASGSSVASALLGYPSGGGVDVNGSSTWRAWSLGGFVQDDIRLTPRLTVNLGMRWDFDAPAVERYDRFARGFDFEAQNPLAQNPQVRAAGLSPKGGFVYAGVGGQPRRISDNDLNNWQPRAGAAYQLGKKTVLRGGWGLFHAFQTLGGAQPGFSQRTNYISSTDGGLTPAISDNILSRPFPLGLIVPPGNSLGLLQNVGLGITFQDPARVVPYTHQFSFGIQRELRGDVLVEASYVASRSRKLYALGNNEGETSTTGVNINASSVADLQRAFGTNGAYFQDPVPNPFRGLMTAGSGINGATVTRETLLRPYPQFTSIRRDGWSIGESSYNSLQVRVEKRYGLGLNLTSSYTLSKNLDGTNFNNDYPRALQPVRQLSEIDATHRWTMAGIYDLPFGKGKALARDAGPALNHLVGGWQINWLILFQSGFPLNIPGGLEPIGNARLPRGQETLDRWFNTCYRDLLGRNQRCVGSEQPVWLQRPAFTLRNTPARFPDLRANWEPSWDLSLFKNFDITERWKLEYRAEFLNAFNTPIFGHRDGASSIVTDFASSNFGAAQRPGGPRTQYNPPRVVQMALKVRF